MREIKNVERLRYAILNFYTVCYFLLCKRTGKKLDNIKPQILHRFQKNLGDVLISLLSKLTEHNVQLSQNVYRSGYNV